MDTDRCSSRIIHHDKLKKAKTQDLDSADVAKVSQLLKAIADPGRMRIVYALASQEMCVCDLAALLGVSESAVSHQLRLLRNLGMVVNRREGTVLYYTITDQRQVDLITIAKEVIESL